jgi:glucose-6-phosphate isomerase
MPPENPPRTDAAPISPDIAGLPVSLDGDAGPPALRFGPGVRVAEETRRRAGDLRRVLSPDNAIADPDETIYTVYRGIAPDPATAEEIERRGLLYVALAMRAGPVGQERARTRGHVNAPAPGTSLPVPEVHEVWRGRGLLYLQSDAAPDVDDVVALEMHPGDRAVVPPGWACLLVNIGEEPLAVGSWRVRDCVPRYESLEARGGMAHFVLAAAPPPAYDFEPNTKYRSVPVPRRAKPRDHPEIGLIAGEPILTAFRHNPDFFRFLLRPQDYDGLWTTLYP